MRLAIISLIVVAITVAGFMGYRLYERHTIQQEFRNAAQTLITDAPLFHPAHEEALYLLETVHESAFDEAFDFGGLLSQAEFDEDTYRRAAIRDMWTQVQTRADDDQTKVLVYMLVKTNAVPIEGQQLPRNQTLEDAIRAATADARG